MNVSNLTLSSSKTGIIFNKGTLNINSGHLYHTASASYDYSCIVNYGTVNMRGGKITSTDWVAIENYNRVIMTAGTIDAGDNTIWNRNPSGSTNPHTTKSDPAVRISGGKLIGRAVYGATNISNYGSGYIYISGATLQNTANGKLFNLSENSTGSIYVYNSTLSCGPEIYAANGTGTCTIEACNR